MWLKSLSDNIYEKNSKKQFVYSNIDGVGDERVYEIQQTDGLKQKLTQQQLDELYLGYCWFIKPKLASDLRSELPEYHMPKAWFWKVIWRFRSYYYQVILATFIINFLVFPSLLVGSSSV